MRRNNLPISEMRNHISAAWQHFTGSDDESNRKRHKSVFGR